MTTADIRILDFWNEVYNRLILTGQVSSRDLHLSRVGQRFTTYFGTKISPEEDLRHWNPPVIKEKPKDLFLSNILLVNRGLADFRSGNNLLLDLCLRTPEENPLFLVHQCFLV